MSVVNMWNGEERRVEEVDRRVVCSKRDNCPEAQRAADTAVEKTFAIMGIDVHDPRQVKKYQQDLMFSHTIRKTADKGVFALIWVVLGGIGLWVWTLIKEALTKGGA